MKNKTFLASIICAFNGLIYAIKTEKNYKYYAVIFLITFIINIILKLDYLVFIFQLITTTGVIASECINTSIENFVNMENTEIKPEIKVIKDVAASSILCWGIAYFTCEIIYIVVKFI